MKKDGYKMVAVGLLVYQILMGLLGEVPRREILNESIRNVYFHVPMWFSMIAVLTASAYFSVRYLQKSQIEDDEKAVEYANVAILLGVLGCLTGSLWASVTWGDFWPNDPKLNSVAVGMLMYFAYSILRGSFEDEQKRGRISAVYNIFAFAVFIPLIFILPRLTDSLHPGNGGNPAFSDYDMNSQMRRVFYPSVIGVSLLAFWIAELRIRIRKVARVLSEKQ